MRCQAKSKRSQLQCGRPASVGLNVCHIHGGKSLRGPAHPNFTNGRYSTVLPTRLLARYREAEKDAELTSLRSELALVDARLADLLTRVDTGESGALWGAVLKAHRAFRRFKTTGDVTRMREALAELEACIDAGVPDYQAWAEIQELIETRRKLCDSETRRLVVLQQMISAEQLTILLGVIVEIIARHVTDRQAISSIATDLQRLGYVGDPAYGLPERPGDHQGDTDPHGGA
jgi:hypothetical protein